MEIPHGLIRLQSCLVWVLARFSPSPKQRKYGWSFAPNVEARRALFSSLGKRADVINPKIFIISMFDSEANVWYDDMPNILAKEPHAARGLSALPGRTLYQNWGSLSVDDQRGRD